MPDQPQKRLAPEVNKVAVAIAARLAMREHRKGKPVAFEWPKRGARDC